jgi:hypothetical protein
VGVVWVAALLQMACSGSLARLARSHWFGSLQVSLRPQTMFSASIRDCSFSEQLHLLRSCSQTVLAFESTPFHLHIQDIVAVQYQKHFNIYGSAGAHPVTAELIFSLLCRYAVSHQALKQLGIDKLMVDKLKNQFDDM